MPYRKEKFENGDIVHIIIRGVDGNLLFRDRDDYYRGIFSIYEFNNLNPVSIKYRREIINRFKKSIRGPTSDKSIIMPDKRDKMVEVLAFCFMPNHIHLLVRQIKDNGITEFMRKIGTGYGGYINRKYKRQGHVFQSSFNAVKIITDEQLRVVFAYIHTNQISLAYKDWKEIKITEEDFGKIIKFVENYKWSSYPDYIGIKNFPSVTQRDFMLELFGGENNCKNFFEEYIKNKGQSKKYSELFLE
ncbi:MAG TPA: transposase [Candidatus Lokiarchaeia archaeon]